MTIVNPGSRSGRDDENTRISTRERSRRIAVALAALLSAGAVFLVNPSLFLPLVVVWIGYSRWRAADRGAGNWTGAALMAAGALGTALIAVATPAAQSFFLVFGTIQFAISALAGLFTGFGALSHVLNALPFTQPILLGLIAGLVLGLLQNWRRWRMNARLSESLVGTALSGERWARSWLTLETFAVNVAAAYLTALLLEALGVFQTGGDLIGTTTAMWKIVASGGSSGAGDYFGVFLLIVMLLALAGALLGFGLVIGFCGGAPIGGLGGLLSWRQMLQSATAAAAQRTFARPHRPGRTRWFLIAFFRGGFEGAISGVLTGWLLAGLHLAKLR